MEVISVDTPLFKHQHLEAELRRLVRSLPAGTRLPAEVSLASQYDCNYQTVRRALKRLVEEGLVVRRTGRGTFVERGAPVDEAGASAKVGMLTWATGNGYGKRLMEALERSAVGMAVELRSVWIGDFEKDAVVGAASLAKQGCVALVIPWFPSSQAEELRKFVAGCGLPVYLPTAVPGVVGGVREAPGVGQSSIMDSLVGYLAWLGCGRIVFIGPDSPADVDLQRHLAGYVSSVSRTGLKSDSHLMGAGARAMEQVARRCVAQRGDLGVIAHDDEHALRFMSAMKKLGLSAPRDFRIIGFNDSEAAQWGEPPLSTVRYDYDLVARWLLGRALNLSPEVFGRPNPPRLQLIVRGSCGGAGRLDDELRARAPSLELVAE